MASDPSRLSIDERLTQFLQSSAARKFEWTKCNCGFWVCEWIKITKGIDPVAEYRGRFKTTKGFIRFIKSSGGNENFSRKIAHAAGLEQTYTPHIGDVGLINCGEAGATMAIKGDSDKWIAKTYSGIATGPWPCIIAWRL